MSAPLFGVILAGGVGSRFWPVSTPARPKQLLPLITDAPMVVDTVERLLPLTGPERLLLLTNASLVQALRAALPQLPPENVIAEPRPAGTAAALCWAALEVTRRGGSGAQMVGVHADWAIGDAEGFRSTLRAAVEAAAARSSLATVGIVPTRPDPGFGYIEPGLALEGEVRTVSRFLEKPDRATAERLIAAGCLWNSGIFAWRAQDFVDEVRAHTPELRDALTQSAAGAEQFFAAVAHPISVDVGVLERSQRVIVLPGRFGWDDVGTWAALARVRAMDADGNWTHGDVVARESAGNVVHAEAGSVVLYGVQGLVVVVRDGLTFVTTVERSHDLKPLVDALPAALARLP